MKRLIAMVISLLLFFTHYAAALSEEDILKPDEAFKLAEPQLIAPDRIKVVWTVADEYYLYKDQFKFTSDNVEIGAPEFSPSKPKRDVTLGKVVDVYYGTAEVVLPISAKDGKLPDSINLTTRHQGCFEKGLCFPPKKNTFNLAALGVQTADASTETPAASTPANASDNNTNTAKPLLDQFKKKTAVIPVEQAFQFEVLPYHPSENALVARVTITPEHYLYKEKFSFQLENADGAQLGKPEFPTAIIKNDPYYGEIEVYEQSLDIKIPLQGELNEETLFLAQYQGCSESSGICYPPVKVKQTLIAADENTPQSQIVSANNATAAASSNNNQVAADDPFAGVLQDKNFLTIIGVFFLAGLGLALTPCVFPMIPILSGIIAGQSGYLSTSRAFMLSLAYVLPMALTYAAVGVIAGLSGANLQVILQTPWVIGLFAFLFVILSLSMFGFYELQMPASVQGRLSDISNRQQGGSILGAGVMGVLSALIVGPCVTAPLISALIFIAQTKDAVLGGLALFALGIGMGAPLLAIGTSAGRLLPRAGAWMDTTKSIFGVMMLGLAIWMLDRIVPTQVTMFLTALLLVVSSIYTGLFDRVTEETSNLARFWKGLGIVMFLSGILLILGVAFGGNSLLQPLKGVAASGAVGHSVSAAPQKEERFQTITTSAELADLLAQAKRNDQFVMMDFYADWCTSCKEVEHMLSQPEVKESLQGILKIKADVTSNDELMKQFGIFGPPQILFFQPSGEELRQFRQVGVIPATDFVKIVSDVRNTRP
ncbi:MAG: protein-disulfide reductase DsbD [bacterium]